jgi:uncharacterized protein YutE (UPF0331/DUF86 family)
VRLRPSLQGVFRRPGSEGRESALTVRRNRSALEREVEVAAQIVIDVCRHLVRGGALGTPDDARHAIEMIAADGLFPEDLAGRSGGLPGLRNGFVHEYLNVDHDRLFADLEQGLRDVEAFRAAMQGAGDRP